MVIRYEREETVMNDLFTLYDRTTNFIKKSRILEGISCTQSAENVRIWRILRQANDPQVVSKCLKQFMRSEKNRLLVWTYIGNEKSVNIKT